MPRSEGGNNSRVLTEAREDGNGIYVACGLRCRFDDVRYSKKVGRIFSGNNSRYFIFEHKRIRLQTCEQPL